VPAHSLRETIETLERLLAREPVDRLIVAGDLVETPRPCVRTTRDVQALGHWLNERNVEFIALQGNHDPPKRPARLETIDVGGWTIGHGHRPIVGPKILFGHHHPTFRLGGVNAPCFLVGPAAIVLPAFSPNAAGLNVLTANVPRPFRDRELRCIVATGEEILDFGPVEDLAERSRRES
jgi:metallophosphoesterase superfamily enzyme